MAKVERTAKVVIGRVSVGVAGIDWCSLGCLLWEDGGVYEISLLLMA